VDLSWDAAPGAVRYSVVRANEDGSNYVIVGSTTQTSYTDATVAAVSAYTYWIRAEGSTTTADSAPVFAFTGRPTSTTVTVSPSPSEDGQFVLLTATVRPFDTSVLREGGGSDMANGDVRLADLDADGRADIVSAGLNRVVAYRSLPGGGFGPAIPVESASREQVEVGDVTGDGRPDVVTRDRYRTVFVHEQLSDGTFVQRWQHDVPTGYMPLVNSIAVADVGGDQRADLVASISGNVPGARLQLYAQTSAGMFAEPVTYPAYHSAEPLALARRQ
jgi:FG-GAP-like repeat